MSRGLKEIGSSRKSLDLLYREIPYAFTGYPVWRIYPTASTLVLSRQATSIASLNQADSFSVQSFFTAHPRFSPRQANRHPSILSTIHYPLSTSSSNNHIQRCLRQRQHFPQSSSYALASTNLLSRISHTDLVLPIQTQSHHLTAQHVTLRD